MTGVVCWCTSPKRGWFVQSGTGVAGTSGCISYPLFPKDENYLIQVHTEWEGLLNGRSINFELVEYNGVEHAMIPD
jgi:hypothetical protein